MILYLMFRYLLSFEERKLKRKKIIYYLQLRKVQVWRFLMQIFPPFKIYFHSQHTWNILSLNTQRYIKFIRWKAINVTCLLSSNFVVTQALSSINKQHKQMIQQTPPTSFMKINLFHQLSPLTINSKIDFPSMCQSTSACSNFFYLDL